jgi:hypothetical protein
MGAVGDEGLTREGRSASYSASSVINPKALDPFVRATGEVISQPILNVLRVSDRCTLKTLALQHCARFLISTRILADPPSQGILLKENQLFKESLLKRHIPEDAPPPRSDRILHNPDPEEDWLLDGYLDRFGPISDRKS